MLYYAASAEMTRMIVENLRDYFADTHAYGSVFSKDYSLLGKPQAYGNRGETIYLTSARFPDRFRLYPHILVNCSLQRMSKFDADNLVLQVDEINEYGRRDVKGFMRGGFLTMNLSIAVRTMDQQMTEEISDLISFWSMNEGWRFLKKYEWFIDPMAGASIVPESYSEGNANKFVYRGNINTTMRGTWIRFQEEVAPKISQFEVHVENLESTLGEIRFDELTDSQIAWSDNAIASQSQGAFSTLSFQDTSEAALVYTDVVLDQLTITDSFLNIYETPTTVSDSVPFNSSVTYGLILPMSPSTPLFLIETIQEMFLGTDSYSETFSIIADILVESLQVSMSNFSSVGFTDAHGALYTGVDFPTSSLSVTDGKVDVFIPVETRTETLNISDSHVQIVNFVTTTPDTLPFSDSIPSYYRELPHNVQDTLTISDTNVSQSNYSANSNSGFTISDSIEAVVHFIEQTTTNSIALNTALTGDHYMGQPMGLLLPLAQTTPFTDHDVHGTPIGLLLLLTIYEGE